MMRDGFRDIVQGWTLVDDPTALAEIIERVVEWAALNGPLRDSEKNTIEFMIESQFARNLERGL